MELTNSQFIQDCLRHAAKAMGEFPEGYVPDQTRFEDFGGAIGTASEAFLSNKQAQAKLREIIKAWPPGFHSAFLETSGNLGQALSAYGSQARAPIGFPDMMAAGIRDPDILKLMLQAGGIAKEVEVVRKGKGNQPAEEASFLSPNSLPQVLFAEIERRVRLQRAPFGRTITTLLGHNALQWLAAESYEGFAKIQPHEFSRTGWSHLFSIRDQISIEQELLCFGKLNEETAKIVVALCWTASALASFMEPGIFLSEAEAHLSSDREGQLTVSYGLATRTMVSFDPSSMRNIVEVLRESLAEPELKACDLMWIAGGLARIRTIKSGHGAPTEPHSERYSLFLSHRGEDAKRLLADKVMALGEEHAVFLDCLTLPRGLINRKFVFDSLLRSQRILLIESPNYDKSEWCRKERWLAKEMQRLRLACVESVSVADAVKIVEGSRGRSKLRKPVVVLDYPVAQRILKDIDYWARHPNKHSLTEKGISIDFLKSIEGFLETRLPLSGLRSVVGAGQEVLKLFAALLSSAPKADPIDPWSTALQYAVASLGIASCANSKMDVRRGIDQMNAALGQIASGGIIEHPLFQENVAAYLAFISAAVTLDLARFTLAPRMEVEIKEAVGDAAVLRDGTLLLDVRFQGARRDLHLKLLLALVMNNIGSVGMIQTAGDTVHELEIDGNSIAILPCVTLHPGMDCMFPELPPFSPDHHG